MAATQIASINYSHEAIADLMITNPQMTQNEIAATLGLTAVWLSQVINSTLFRDYYANRRKGFEGELNDAVKARTLQLTLSALDKLADVLDKPAEELDDRVVVDSVDKLLKYNPTLNPRTANAVAPVVLTQNNFSINPEMLNAAQRARERAVQALVIPENNHASGMVEPGSEYLPLISGDGDNDA